MIANNENFSVGTAVDGVLAANHESRPLLGDKRLQPLGDCRRLKFVGMSTRISRSAPLAIAERRRRTSFLP